MKREQILETIKNNLKPKYEIMSTNHSAYLILKTKEYISLVQEYKTINAELERLSKEVTNYSKERNALFAEIFEDHSKDIINKPKIDELDKTIKVIEIQIRNLISERAQTSEELNGKYDQKTRKNIGGLVNSLNNFDYKIVSAKLSDSIIQVKIKNYYEQLLFETSESLTNKIEGYKPTNIYLVSSKHDINFILSFENNKDRSFTINTIIAGGDIQTVHRRTLTTLHKGIAK